MRLRRASLASLIVALMALSGATMAPTRGAGITGAASIVWLTRDERPAPMARKARAGSSPATSVGAPHTSPIRPAVTLAPVRHALFQRPPPDSF